MNFHIKERSQKYLKLLLSYNHKTSLWTLNHIPYSGFAVSYYLNNTLKEKFGILEGKKQGEAILWYAAGHDKNVANYHQGKLHGEKKIWIKDTVHVLIGHYNYLNGMPHGEQKKWYSTGEIFKQMNLNMGKEEGLQRAFRKNWSLYANYEARNGRIFGIKNGKLCYELKNETIASNE